MVRQDSLAYMEHGQLLGSPSAGQGAAAPATPWAAATPAGGAALRASQLTIELPRGMGNSNGTLGDNGGVNSWRTAAGAPIVQPGGGGPDAPVAVDSAGGPAGAQAVYKGRRSLQPRELRVFEIAQRLSSRASEVLYAVLDRFQATAVSALSGRVMTLQGLRESGQVARVVALALSERHAQIWRLRCAAQADLSVSSQAASGVPPSERQRPVDLVTRYLEALQGTVRDFSVCLGSGKSRADWQGAPAGGQGSQAGARDDMTLASGIDGARRPSLDRAQLAE